MILVLGGIASGKLAYAHSLGYGDDQIDKDIASDAPVLYALEEILRAGPLQDHELARLARKEVVICCEVGLGVVPLDANERSWRELVGRTCCTLAEHAQLVVRLVCGIPVPLFSNPSERDHA